MSSKDMMKMTHRPTKLTTTRYENMKILPFLLLIVFAATATVAQAQERNYSAQPDSEYNYMPVRDISQPDSVVKPNALGLDLMIGNTGFGLGFSYRHAITSTMFWTVNVTASEAKAPNEIDYIDPFTGQKFVPGKINQLFVFPAMVGLQYRLFKNQITDSFRPYVFAGLGPNAVLAAPYDQPLGYSFSHSRGYFGMGAYFGAGAYFGLDPHNLVGVSLRYYVLPMSHGIESLQNEPMANFNTFFIAFNIATQY